MMRGTDKWAAAVRRQDGTVVVTKQPVSNFAHKHKWAKWPLIRGNIALFDGLSLGIRSLIYSFNVLVEEENQKLSQEQDNQQAEDHLQKRSSKQASSKPAKPARKQEMGWIVWLSIIPAFALGIGLFILLPTWAVDWVPNSEALGQVRQNLIEALARIIAILGYIFAISLMPDIRRIFQYHGAEHATINCFEAGEEVNTKTCLKYGPLHPRCGTSFLLLFIVVKLLLNTPLPWLELLPRMGLRLLMVAPAAAVAFEILRFGGRHRYSLFGHIMAWPGMLMQKLTTRQPDEKQLQMGIYALSAVAEEIDLPTHLPRPVYAEMDGKILNEEFSQPTKNHPEQNIV